MSRRERHNRIFAAAAVLLVLLLCACGSVPAVQEVPAEETAQPVAETAVPTTPQPTEMPVTVEAAIDLQPVTEVTEAPAPPFSPDLSEQEPVEDSFFDDTAFVGNSLVRGLELYGGMKGGDFRAVTSTTVVNIDMNRTVDLKDGTKGTLLQKLFEKQYGKIYILLGINEISFEPEYFAELYSEMLDKIAENEPDAEIYIMSLTPVTEKKSGEGYLFSAERIAQYNEKLYALAQDRGCRYVDLVEALADESGFLPAAESTDGIHLKQDKYPVWADYLRTHYA